MDWGLTLEQLDENCVKILVALFGEQQAHYNELYRLISKRNRKFSKPTFNTHLRHLEKSGFIKKTPDKGQLVTISLNLEKIGKTREYYERIERILKSESENKKWFFSLPEKEQVKTLLAFLSTRKLNEIKAQIEFGLDPESFEKWFAVKLWSIPLLERANFWMIKKCVEDEVYRKKILAIIDDVLEK
jgi:DNA-binding HxlR family transcriptional regulator